MSPLRSTWFLGCVHAAQGKQSGSLEFLLRKKSGMEPHIRQERELPIVGRLLLPDTVFLAMAATGEVAQLFALVERKTGSEPL